MARTKTKGSWTRDDVKQLKKLFPDRPTAEVAAELGRPTEAVKKKASRMGLKKSRKYMKSLGRR
jgi:DNA-directed RNA polymerase specialized sigma24 family protein